VTKLSNYDLILGKPWLTQFNPDIDWSANVVTVVSKNHVYTLHAQDAPDAAVCSSLNSLAAFQVKRALRHECDAFLAVLKSSGNESETAMLDGIIVGPQPRVLES